jgi:hypothetical protein
MGFMNFNFRQIDADGSARSAVREFQEQSIRQEAPARRAAIR